MRSDRLYHRIHIRWDFIEFGQVGHQYLFGSDAGRFGGDLRLNWCMLYYQSSWKEKVLQNIIFICGLIYGHFRNFILNWKTYRWPNWHRVSFINDCLGMFENHFECRLGHILCIHSWVISLRNYFCQLWMDKHCWNCRSDNITIHPIGNSIAYPIFDGSFKYRKLFPHSNSSWNKRKIN